MVYLLSAGVVHGLVDQASFALLYYKMHKLSITLPLHSKTFWYYAPSCLLSDILVIGGLQVVATYLHPPLHSRSDSDTKYNHGELEALLQDVEDHVSLVEHEKFEDSTVAKERLVDRYARYLRECCKAVVVGLSLLTSFVSFTSIVAYKSERAVFTWKQAYDNLGSARVLKPIFDEFWPLFMLVAATIIMGGLVVSAFRLGLGLLLRRQRSQIRIRVVGTCLLVWLIYAAIVRPPIQALQATNLLLDGFSFALSLFFGLSERARAEHRDASSANGTTIYGSSNIYSDRLTPVAGIDHVFLIYLESGESAAWPYTPEFCKTRDCADIAPEYDTPDHFTPFFKSLIDKDPHAIYMEDFRTNVAFTTKSHLATECGTLPEVKDGVKTESFMKTALPCLPDLLRAIDGSFKSTKFIAQDTTTDAFGRTAKTTGWDRIFGRADMERAWHEKRPLTNWWGYGDDEIAPFWWNWIDARLAHNERIFMSWSGSTMHLPFDLPPHMEPKKYTTGAAVTNGYLNTLRYTDKQLELFFAGLKERDILDKSLVIIQGDHGPRIGADGSCGIWGYFERIYKTPFLVRAPGLISSAIPQTPQKPFVSIDVLPTVLDALGVDPHIVSRYPGRSLLRRLEADAVRDTFHVQLPGNQYPHINRYDDKHTYKARRSGDGDTCATDIQVDPDETFIYCAISGWNPVPYIDEVGIEQFGDGVEAGVWKAGSQEEAGLIAFAKDAERLLNEHLDVNSNYWDPKNAEQYKASNHLILQELAKSSTSSSE